LLKTDSAGNIIFCTFAPELRYMQDQIRDSVSTAGGFTCDSISLQQPVFIETNPSGTAQPWITLYSKNLEKQHIPDWYFIIIVFILSAIASARIVYGKVLYSIWVSAYSYQFAGKTYKERGLVQRRVGLGLDLLYLVNASLFVYLINQHFFFLKVELPAYQFVLLSFFILSILVLIRLSVMRITAFIFERSELFLGFLYHYFIFSKVLGMFLIPFLIAIPYTSGNLQEVIVYTGISMILAIQMIRLIRVTVYVLKNVIFLFYLILYLCVLEILPVLVVVKIILSLAQV
jgi:hypothetical protein